MATKTITGKVTRPDGSNAANAVIVATLSQACVIAGTQEVVATSVKTTAAADGTYTLTLQANNDLSPTGTFYTVTDDDLLGGFYNRTIVVPQTAGPFVITSIETAPPTLGASPSHVSTLTVDALTAGQVVYADTGGLAATDSTFLFDKTAKALTATKSWFKGEPWFDVKAYGAKGDGVADDTVAIQAAITAVAAASGGIVFFPPGQYKVTNCLSIPAQTSVLFLGSGMQTTYPGTMVYKNGSLLLATGTLGNQPVGVPAAMTLKTMFSQLNTNGGGDVEFRDLSLGYSGATGTAIFVGSNQARFKLASCAVGRLAIGYWWTPNSNYQTEQFEIFDCNIHNGFQNGIYWDNNGPIKGEIRGCQWRPGVPGAGINNAPGGLLYNSGFWDWNIHDNSFDNPDNQATSGIGADIYLQTGAPNIDVSACWIHDNLFAASPDACIYLLTQAVGDNTHFWQGYRIHDNVFNDWGHQNVVSGLKSAIYLDNPSYDVSVGQNVYYGSANASYGVNVVGNQATQRIIIDPLQQMRFVAVSNYRINGVNLAQIGPTIGATRITGTYTTGGLQLDGGGASGVHVYAQEAYGYNGTLNYLHWLETNHSAGAAPGNQFRFWTSDGTSTGVFPTNGILGLVIDSGHLLVGSGAAPTTSALGANVTSVTFTGNDRRGTVAIVMAGGLARATRIATCTFLRSYGATTPQTFFSNQTSGNLALVNLYQQAASTGVSFDIASDQALVAGTYTFGYIIEG